MCVSVPPVRHIPRFGQQLHPRPPTPRCAALRWRPAKTSEATRTQGPARAQHSAVWDPPELRKQTAQRGAVNEEGAGATPVRAGLSHRCDSSQTRSSITGNTRPLEAHSQWHISKKAFMSWLLIAFMGQREVFELLPQTLLHSFPSNSEVVDPLASSLDTVCVSSFSLLCPLCAVLLHFLMAGALLGPEEKTLNMIPSVYLSANDLTRKFSRVSIPCMVDGVCDSDGMYLSIFTQTLYLSTILKYLYFPCLFIYYFYFCLLYTSFPLHSGIK